MNTSDYTDHSLWIKVIDHDGVASDGGSHYVEVELPDPDNRIFQMHYDGARGPNEVAYYVGGDFELSQPLSGDYIFRVQDPDGNQGTYVDTLVVNPLDLIDPDSLQPSNKNPEQKSITAYFDNVYIDGVLYDDFDSYGIIDEIDHNLWSSWYEGASIENYNASQALKLESSDVVGRGNGVINVSSGSAINTVPADVTVDSIIGEGSIKAQIRRVIYNKDNMEHSATITLTKEGVYCSVGSDYQDRIPYSWPPDSVVFDEELMAYSPGQTVTVQIGWDGSTVTFAAKDKNDIDFISTSYTPGGLVIPPLWNRDFNFRVRVNLNVNPTDTFSWEPVTGANQYSVRVYDQSSGNSLWNGWVGNETSQRPYPGAIPNYAYLNYRVEAMDAHRGFDVDNVSRTPAHSNERYRFYTTSDEPVAPHIELDNHGVHTGNDTIFGEYLAFWLKIHDAQGVPENIKSVKVLTPDDDEYVLHYNAFWDTGSPNSGFYSFDSESVPLTPGDYIFTVEDMEGNIDAIVETLLPENIAPIGYPDVESITEPFAPMRNSVLGDTGVSFNWEDVAGAAFYRVEIFDKYAKRLYSFNTTDSFYDLAPGFLKEGQMYRYRISTRREFFDQNIDNASWNPWRRYSIPFFTPGVTGGVSPIDLDLDNQGVMLMTVPDFRNPGESRYVLMFKVKVTDADSVPENVASVTVTYPDDSTTLELWYDEAISDTEAYYIGFEIYDDPGDVQLGDYSFVATDHDDNQVGDLGDIIDNLAPNALPFPEGLVPEAESYDPSTTPTISWDSITGALRYQVQIFYANDTIH